MNVQPLQAASIEEANALRFWGAAFEPFCYTLTREIDRRAHG